MASSEPDGKVEIKVLKAKNLRRLGRSRFNDKFRVRIYLGDQTFKTDTKGRNLGGLGSDVSWNAPFPFTFGGQMPNLTLKVFGDDSNEKDAFAGGTVVSYADLCADSPLNIGVARTYTFSLSSGNEEVVRQSPQLKIQVKMMSPAAEEPVDDLAPILKQASDALDRLKEYNIHGVPEQAAAAGSVAVNVGSILEKIGNIADIMDEVTKIHPYVTAAWSILDLTRKVIKAQMKEDDSIRDLSEQMRSLLDRIRTFVEKLDSVSSDIHNDEKDILRCVGCTSRDCAKFIISFCGENFAKRAMKCALFGKAGQKIDGFKSEFSSLEKSFNEKVWDGTNIIAHQILKNQKTNQEVLDRVDMNAQHMLKAQTAGEVAEFMVRSASLLASSHRSCHPGTQVAIRKTISDWIDRVDEDVPRVLLLSGMAGTGKSTIAHTIADEFEVQDRPYTSFTFNRRAQPPPSARMLFPHIAAFLAAFYPAVRKALTAKKDIALGVQLERQLRELIIEPLKQLAPTVPSLIVIAIDGLDEADSDGEQAARLASSLVMACDELPSNIRILVTSRVETYVVKTMWPSAVQRIDMPKSSNESLAEIRLFIHDQLQGVGDMDEIHYDNLMTTSQGLYQWAATACKEIVGAPLLGGSTPLQRYNMVVASGLRRDESGLLDSLYEDVLNRAFDSQGRQLLKKVIAALFAMMEPMTLDAFRQLYVQLGLGESSDVDCILPYLPSILDGISDRTRHVQPNHTSLRDFFLDPDRSGPLCVKDLMPGIHNHTARRSLEIVSTFLPQDEYILDFARIWQYEEYNYEYVASVVGRVQGQMTRLVEYSTLYYAKHLAEAPAPEEAFWLGLEASLLADDRALPWIEVFCLLAAGGQSGCMQFLAHIAKKPGSSCPSHIRSAIDLGSIICMTNAGTYSPFKITPRHALIRLGQIYSSVAWIVKLQRQARDDSLVTIGTGFFVRVDGGSYDVILTTARNLLNDNGKPHTNIVVSIPKQILRLDGASRFTDVRFSVLPTDVYVCADFSRRQQLETDWGAIRLPRGTARENGFHFSLQEQGLWAPDDPDTAAVGTYGQLSWIDHRLHLPVDDSNNSVVDTHTAMTAHSPVTRLASPVASGAPVYAFSTNTGQGGLDRNLYVWGICNPTYGDNAYTELTPLLICELGLWLGFLGKPNTQLRWLSDSPSWDNFYLFVNEGPDAEQDSRLYLKRGSGSTFNVSMLGPDSYSEAGLFGYGSKLLGQLGDNDQGRLACVSASDPRHRYFVHSKMEQHADGDQQASGETLTFCHKMGCSFKVESTPITSSGHDDSKLFAINLRLRRTELGLNEFETLKFALE